MQEFPKSSTCPKNKDKAEQTEKLKKKKSPREGHRASHYFQDWIDRQANINTRNNGLLEHRLTRVSLNGNQHQEPVPGRKT